VTDTESEIRGFLAGNPQKNLLLISALIVIFYRAQCRSASAANATRGRDLSHQLIKAVEATKLIAPVRKLLPYQHHNRSSLLIHHTIQVMKIPNQLKELKFQ
jgi:hypothetical protein